MGDVATVQTFQTQQMFSQAAAPSGMFLGVSTVVDGARNLFVGYVDFDPAGSGATFVRVREYSPASNTTVLAEWRIIPNANFKIDDVSLSHRGANLLVAVVTHTLVAGPNRARAVEIATIPGVFVIG